MFLVVEEQDSTSSELNMPLLSMSKQMACFAHVRRTLQVRKR